MGVSRGGEESGKWKVESGKNRRKGVIVQAQLFQFPEYSFSGTSEKCDKMGKCVVCQLTSMSDPLPL